MFIAKMFKYSMTSLTKMFDLKKENLVKVILYFILLNLILAFPINLTLIQNKGITIEKMGLNLTTNIPDWFPQNLPKDCVIENEHLSCSETTLFTQPYDDFEFVVNPAGDYVPVGKALVFVKDNILFYVDGKPQTYDYSGFETSFSFQSFSTLSKEDAARVLLDQIQVKFMVATIVFGVLLYTGQMILMNLIFLLIASFLGLLLKYGHRNFLTYKEIFKLFVYSATWPAIICFFLGIFGGYAFTTVIFQFGTPLVFLILYYRIIKFQY